MTSKPKQSIAIQRQIPAHIRESYPLFVEFLKSYYDFLEQTQSQELEKIRDVDTTLEEFIDRFKSEISTGMPVELANDKRMLIKHLKEFYLSRGSEASYKFLFRTLFNTEAELFYPSTQVLRVSDGKWQQDVSIFVKIPEGGLPLDPLNGNFINIQNSKKRFTTYAERVVQYKTDVYEIYIARDYINELQVGATVTFSEVVNGVTKNYIGNILPCPSKVSIYKAGAGFKVGELFALKTNIGKGCVIKVTKVGPIGEIKNIQVISFGLDYLSTFYSYLSSKDIQAFEYVHPAQLNHPYNPSDDHYNENSGGFTDYGFASKFNESEAYMAYDTTIPIGDPAKASDRFYAEPSYVGPVTRQFYADSTVKVVDEDLAIIQIDLGPVAKYPGYYLQQDGFISDQMYIQDGKYYQAFSYVIKVEEELRKYADVVKKILHPAGLKMYSEYSIFNVLNVSAVQDAIKNLLQFLDNVNTIDQGYNYDAYMIDESALDLAYKPVPGAGIVYSRFNKSASFVTKGMNESVSQISAPTKSFTKAATPDDFTLSDLQVKLVGKIISDALSSPTDTGYNYDAYVLSLVGGNVVSTPDPNSNIVFSEAFKTAQFTVKNLVESVVNIETNSSFLTKPFSELFSLVSAPSKTVEKPISGDDFTLSDAHIKNIDKSLLDVIAMQDAIEAKEFAKALADSVATALVYDIASSKNLTEFISLDDADIISYTKSLTDETISSDIYVGAINKLSSDFFFVFDTVFNEIQKQFDDTVVSLDALNNAIDKGTIEDFVDIADAIAIIRAIFFQELISLVDAYSNSTTKNYNDNIGVPDAFSKQTDRILDDSINIITAGAIALDPYDAEIYAAPEEQYQANTPIT